MSLGISVAEGVSVDRSVGDADRVRGERRVFVGVSLGISVGVVMSVTAGEGDRVRRGRRLFDGSVLKEGDDSLKVGDGPSLKVGESNEPMGVRVLRCRRVREAEGKKGDSEGDDGPLSSIEVTVGISSKVGVSSKVGDMAEPISVRVRVRLGLRVFVGEDPSSPGV